MLRAEAIEVYRSARKAGRKTVAEQNTKKLSGLLPVLEPLLPETCGEIPLGLYEVPLKKIRGTFAAGRASALSCDFMPLLDETSEFAAKWQSLYASASERGITEAIRLYEYLGFYYVVEGHKRVSVAGLLQNYSLLASATRLLPPEEGSAERAVFAEITGNDRRKIIRHMWFSQPGRISELRKLSAADDSQLEDAFTAFRTAYHKQDFHLSIPNITTGDAFWQYCKIYGFQQNPSDSLLQRNIARCRPQWELLANPEPLKTVSDMSGLGHRPLFTFSRGSNPSAAFAFRGTETGTSCFSAEVHKVGQFALTRAFPDLPVSSSDNLSGCDAYDRMSLELGKPHILFVTDSALSGEATRFALEHRNTLVMLCHDQPVGLPGTYSANTEETAFLMGILAGSLSRNASLGWIHPPRHLARQDLQAFAQGAVTIRPASRIYAADCNGGRTHILKRWAERGVDIACIPCSAEYPSVKAFPGVFAQLCSLSQNGGISEVLASAAYHWDAFYVSFLREIISSGTHPEHPHFRLGLDNGVLDIHPGASIAGGRDCLLPFRRALTDGLITPVDENRPVEVFET